MNDSDRQLQLFSRDELPAPPGTLIQTEMDARGWGQADLARILGRPLPTINEIIQGKKQVTPETAFDLAQAFGTTPDFWMAREAAYRLSLVEREDNIISDRARVYEMAPVKEMERRGWINRRDTLPEIEAELCKFFEVSNLGESPRLAVNARSANSEDGVNQAQLAWCYRALKMARTLRTKKFEASKIPVLKRSLKNLSALARGVEDVPNVLDEYGIRLVVVETLRQTKIDGAAFWLDVASPVIALSMRFDRIDYFWFTLMHELSHIEHRDAAPIDSDMMECELNPVEERANREGADALIGTEEINSFIRRLAPNFHRTAIIQFANRVKSHPGIVVGQLHFRKAMPYSSGRAMLLKVRDFLSSRALTDGFDFNLPVLN